MKSIKTGVLILLVLLLGAPQTNADEIKRDYIIKYKVEGDSSKKNYKKKFKHLENTVVASLTVQEYEALKSEPNVEYIERDGLIYSSEVTTNQTDYVPQSLIDMHIPEVQQTGLLGNGVKVAVLDSGINDHSQDIKAIGGVSFVPEEINFNDMFGHGTAVASIIASQINNIGLTGIAPNVDLYAVKVLDNVGRGSISQLISGIEWAIDNKMDIINLSLGTDTYFSSLKDAVKLAFDNNVVLIAATGNEGVERVMYPAKFKDVIAVGAVDADYQLAPFSNTGNEVDLVAPGVGVYTLNLNDEIIQSNGTSFSTPYITAIAALIKQKYPDYSNKKIANELSKSAKKIGDKKQYGAGIVDALYLINK